MSAGITETKRHSEAPGIIWLTNHASLTSQARSSPHVSRVTELSWTSVHAPSNFALRSLPDVFSGSSPLSPLHLHSDLQSLREIALFGSPSAGDGGSRSFFASSLQWLRWALPQPFLPEVTPSPCYNIITIASLQQCRGLDACMSHADLRSEAVPDHHACSRQNLRTTTQL